VVEDEGLVIEDFTTTVHDEVDKQVQDYHSYGDLKQDIFVTLGVWGGLFLVHTCCGTLK